MSAALSLIACVLVVLLCLWYYRSLGACAQNGDCAPDEYCAAGRCAQLTCDKVAADRRLSVGPGVGACKVQPNDLLWRGADWGAPAPTHTQWSGATTSANALGTASQACQNKCSTDSDCTAWAFSGSDHEGRCVGYTGRPTGVKADPGIQYMGLARNALLV